MLHRLSCEWRSIQSACSLGPSSMDSALSDSSTQNARNDGLEFYRYCRVFFPAWTQDFPFE